MALSQMFSDAYTVLGQKEKLDESRRQREAQQSLGDILGSGRPLDEQTIMEAYRLDPTVGASLSKLYSGQQTALLKQQDMASRQGVRGAGALAGAAKQLLDGWNNNMPEEKKTLANWRRGYLPARAAAIRSGIATPEMLPEDLGPQDLEGMIGLGYSPAQQDLSEYREEEAGARQGRFEQSQAGMAERSAASIGAANQRAALGRSAADARASQSLAAAASRSSRGGGGSPVGGKAPSGYRWTDAGDLEPIPGGPAAAIGATRTGKPMTPANAGKVEMMQQAERDIEGARSLVFDEGGDLNRLDLGLARAPGGGLGENARLLASKIENAVSAKYRLETGAAGNEEEVRSIARRFMPSPLDTKASAADKLDRLQEFMRGALNLAGAPAGGGTPSARPPALRSRSAPAASGPAPSLEDIEAEIQRRRALAGGR